MPRVRERIAAARKDGYAVAFTRDTHTQGYLSTREGKNLPVPHCIAGSAGWQLAVGLAQAGDKIFVKLTFGSTALAQKVKDGGYERVELIGLCTDICVISNALLIKAFCPEIRICVRESCCAGVTEKSHRTALDAMRACQVLIV